jgi:hypothetical protein
MSDAPKRPGRKPGDPNHHRRGNGVGVQWGGAKRGGISNSKAGIAGPGRGITGKTVAELMAAQGAREVAADAWLAILADPAHPKHADMVAKAAERLDGAPEQRVTSEVTNRYVVRAPAEPASEDEWLAQHRPPAP